MKTEPKIGARVAWNNVRYRCYERGTNSCQLCDMCGRDVCGMVQCGHLFRKDGKDVVFIREGHYSRKELSILLKKRRGL